MRQSLDLLVFNKYEQWVAVLSDEGTACPYFNSEWLVQVNGVLSLKFDVPRSHPASAHLDNDGTIILFRFDWEPPNAYHEYRVFETELNHDDNLLMTVYCEHARNELLDNIITDKRPTDNTIAEALGTALAGSRWEVGTTSDLGLNSTTFYYINSLEAINTIISVWGGEQWYRTIVIGNKITARCVDIVARLGRDTGKRFEYQKDTDTIKRTIDYTGIKTAIYGRGQGVQSESGQTYTRRLTFADVEWSVANGDPVDKPLGQEWVGDPLALQEYGYLNTQGGHIHRYDVLVDDQQTDAMALLVNTWTYLQTKNKPLVQYDFTILDTYAITGGDRSWEKVDIGDGTYCIDDDIGAELEARVIEIKRDLSDLTIADVKIGNFISHDFYSSTAQQVAEVQKTIIDNAPTWSSGSQTTDATVPDIIPDMPTHVTATGAFANIIIDWDYLNTIVIGGYEVYGSDIQGFTPSDLTLLYRGKSSSFGHAVGSNQQWYYRVRAVNTNGTPGAFSDEVTASTVRLVTDDMMFGSVTADILADLSVDASKMADGTITNDKLADLVVTAAKLADGAITNDKISDQAVTAAKIIDGSITTAKLALRSVTSEKIATGAITNDHIDAGAITEAKMKWSTHLIF